MEGCNAKECGMEGKLEGLFERFTTVSEKLTDNQVEMRMSIQHLTDNMKGIKRLGDRMEKLEDKVDVNSSMMWKIVGFGIAVASIVPFVVSHIL